MKSTKSKLYRVLWKIFKFLSSYFLKKYLSSSSISSSIFFISFFCSSSVFILSKSKFFSIVFSFSLGTNIISSSFSLSLSSSSSIIFFSLATNFKEFVSSSLKSSGNPFESSNLKYFSFFKALFAFVQCKSLKSFSNKSSINLLNSTNKINALLSNLGAKFKARILSNISMKISFIIRNLLY